VGSFGPPFTGPELWVYYFLLGLGAFRQCVLLLQEVVAWWDKRAAIKRRRR
jgi:hypothetical protein